VLDTAQSTLCFKLCFAYSWCK